MNIPEMTVGKNEQEKECENLLMENKELFVRCNAYEERLWQRGEQGMSRIQIIFTIPWIVFANVAL